MLSLNGASRRVTNAPMKMRPADDIDSSTIRRSPFTRCGASSPTGAASTPDPGYANLSWRTQVSPLRLPALIL